MKKRLLFLSLFLIFVILFSSMAPVIGKSEAIAEKVFRLHILANSDSEADQQLKMKVRDKVMQMAQPIFADCHSVSDAVRAAEQQLTAIQLYAQNVIRENGFCYPVTVTVTKDYFNVREYDDFVLPSGCYDCLKIVIGEGKGKNWWCVLFPSVCLSGCTEDLRDTLTQEEMEIVQNGHYIIRFKAVEIYEKIKYKIQHQ